MEGGSRESGYWGSNNWLSDTCNLAQQTHPAQKTNTVQLAADSCHLVIYNICLLRPRVITIHHQTSVAASGSRAGVFFTMLLARLVTPHRQACIGPFAKSRSHFSRIQRLYYKSPSLCLPFLVPSTPSTPFRSVLLQIQSRTSSYITNPSPSPLSPSNALCTRPLRFVPAQYLIPQPTQLLS